VLSYVTQYDEGRSREQIGPGLMNADEDKSSEIGFLD
jgi:hypothetical protein